MARQLDDLLAAQRSFVADASHQLRSPLTALRLRLENLEPVLPAHQADRLDAAIDEVDRMTRLVSDLLRLARADERPATEVVDAARIIADRLDTWTAVAETRGVTLRSHGLDQQAFVHAVSGGVEQIIDNLIDNALNASASGGTITVTVASTPDGVDLAVSDQGPGLDDGQKVAALRRFWRGDTSAGGTGLGLPIVAALTAASNGRLALTDASGGGLTVAVRLVRPTDERSEV
jgi:signal transduction histidine kinase